MEVLPPAQLEQPMGFLLQRLPHAKPGGMAGVLELLNDRGGRDDLYHLAESLVMEVDDLFPIVEEAVLLGFARSVQGDLEITEEGKAFVAGDIATRRTLFREAALAHVALLKQIRGALVKKSDGSMPLDFFRSVLDERMPSEEVQKQIETALDWGRYAEIFTYDAETDRLLLSQPPANGRSLGCVHSSVLKKNFTPPTIVREAISANHSVDSCSVPSFGGWRTPVSGVKHPFISLPGPSVWYPDGTAAGWKNPSSRNPHISLPIPALVSRNPSVARMWWRPSNRCRTMRRGRRWGSNNNLRQRHLRDQQGRT
jgi:hypothetical protein